jgi:hypothetical protein
LLAQDGLERLSELQLAVGHLPNEKFRLRNKKKEGNEDPQELEKIASDLFGLSLPS